MKEALRTYDIAFDQNQAKEVYGNIEQQQKLASYLTTQMETHLGERFNICLSRYEYDVIDGRMWGKDMNEPFIESLRKGRDFRKENGNEIDHPREDAEVIGFEKIESKLLNENTPTGTMMLSISQRGGEGSSYRHNFYDVFTLRENERGEKYIEARRYASELEKEEYSKKLEVFGYQSEGFKAEDFLANPIEIPNALTPDDIHTFLQKENSFMSEEEFELIRKSCKTLIKAYADSIVQQPYNDLLHKTLFNAILNKADDVIDKNEYENIDKYVATSVQEDVERYAFEPVREVMTGCGLSGGYEGVEQMNSPFSVSSYTPDKYGERTFNCPSCKKENIRPFNQLLTHCLHCKSDKVSC